MIYLIIYLTGVFVAPFVLYTIRRDWYAIKLEQNIINELINTYTKYLSTNYLDIDTRVRFVGFINKLNNIRDSDTIQYWWRDEGTFFLLWHTILWPVVVPMAFITRILNIMMDRNTKQGVSGAVRDAMSELERDLAGK